jgi:hypothetical protein
MTSAFEHWLIKGFPTREKMAAHIALVITNGSAGKLYRDLLEETGDIEYTKETFLKAADLVIQKVKKIKV